MTDTVQTWVADAASENALMLEGGRLAAERASDPQVKRFAQSLMADHQAAQADLVKAAAAAGVTVDSALTPVAAARLDQLRQRAGTDFDRVFLFAVVGEATRANLDYSYEIGKGDSKPVQDYARRTLMKIQDELARATALATPIAGSMAMTPGTLGTPAQPAIPLPAATPFPTAAASTQP